MKISNLKKWFSIASGLLSSTVCGMLLYSFSVLINPLQDHFGWSYSEVSLAFSFCYFISSFCCFLAGKLIYVLGAKFVVFIGGILTGLGFLFSAFISSKYHFYLFYGIISGLGCSFLYLPPIVVIPKWWPERYVFMTGFAIVGLGFGSIIMGPLASWIIINYSWRQVFIYCGLAMLFMGVLSAILLNDLPEDNSTNKKNLKNFDFSIIKTPNFWYLYLIFFCAVLASIMLISQLVPYLIEIGYSVIVSGYYISVFSIGNMLSRLLVGILAEGKDINNCLAITLFIQSIAMVFLSLFGSNPLLLGLLIFIIGWSLGSVSLLFPSITKKYFGAERHATNYGLMLTSCSFSGLLGSLFVGFIKDITESYLSAFLISACISLLASWFLLVINSDRWRT